MSNTSRRLLLLTLLVPATGCAASATQSTGPAALPTTVAAYDGRTRSSLSTPDLLRQLRNADFVLLGELHDNAVHHETRGRLLAAVADIRPAVVFEQLASAPGALPLPDDRTPSEAWLDGHGFDRTAWRWPLHRPVVEAAMVHGRGIWGSGLSREFLNGAVRNGKAALPPALQDIMTRVPLDSAARTIMDRELVDGHCGQLPDRMVGGMRTAQEARDASMAGAMLAAARAEAGPVWLVAGNGHVRGDVAVPRILRPLAPGKSVLAVGLLEAPAGGGLPAAEAWAGFDLVLVTPRAERADPCASFRAPQR